MRLQGPDPIVVRASKRMRNDGTLITQYGGTVLRLELDSVPLWRGDRVGLKQLADYFAEYLYLPRLRDSSVLLGAIAQGLGMLTWETESFGYAERYDETTTRYQGLVYGHARTVALDEHGVLVKPEAALRQIEADDAARRAREEAERQRREDEQRQFHEQREGYASSTGDTSNEFGVGSRHEPAERAQSDSSGDRQRGAARRLRRYHGAARGSHIGCVRPCHIRPLAALAAQARPESACAATLCQYIASRL